MDFVDKGSDYNLLKSLSRQGLVQKEVTVQGKHGTYIRKQWVSASQPSGIPQRPATHKDEPHAKKQPKTLYFPIGDSGNNRTQAFTYSDVMVYYKNHKSEINTSLDKYIKTHYFVSDGTTQTRDFYKTSKGYTKERQKLHNSIVKGIVDSANSPKEGEQPIAILMGGGSASGKGTLRESLVIPRLQSDGISVGISDCDDIKSQLPEYEHFLKQNPESAALRVQDESMDVAMEALDTLVKNNKNLLFDGTMKDPVKYNKIIDKLRNAGYQIQIVGADVPIDTAIKRSNIRAEKTGRKVPEGIIRGSHGGFSTTYPQLTSKVDRYSLYDNSGDYPVLIQDENNVYDYDAYDRFIQKGKDHQVNKTIKRLAQTYDVPQKNIRNLYDNGVTLEEIEEYLELNLNDDLEDLV